MTRSWHPFVAALLTWSCATASPIASAPSASAASASTSAASDTSATVAVDDRASGETYDGPPKRVLVELYSSQGCNSCPKADDVVGALASQGLSRQQVVPLTFHVTYWDDLGWQDPYAEPLFDQRQISYAQMVAQARSADENTIRGPYTPQMVVDGAVHFSGALADVAHAEIERARLAPTLVEIEPAATLEGTGETRVVVVDVHSRRGPGADFDTNEAKVGLFAALSQRTVLTEVPRGENAGKTLTEHWVVRDFAGPKLFRSAREVNETEFRLELPPDVGPDASEIVVFAQDLSSLRVIGVATAPIVAPD